MVVSTYTSLANVRMQPNLIVAIEDGIYTDTDAIDFKPIDDWATWPLRNYLTLVFFSRLRVSGQLLVILGGRCKCH
ncbi:Initiation-specific alpha-1 6-mannosyltransferase [Colletotrichum asianum]